MTFDDFNQWFSQVDGKAIEAEDSSNYAQCFDLAFSWCDFLGIPRDSIRHLDAYQIFTNPNPDTSQYWDLIVNTPTGVPTVGSLVVWGTGVGVAGHVSVFKEGDTASFRSEDQNWAGIQKAKLVNHSYNFVLGWLSPKGTTSPSEPSGGGTNMLAIDDVIKAAWRSITGSEASDFDVKTEDSKTPFVLEDLIKRLINASGYHTDIEFQTQVKEAFDNGYAKAKAEDSTVPPAPLPTPPPAEPTVPTDPGSGSTPAPGGNTTNTILQQILSILKKFFGIK